MAAAAAVPSTSATSAVAEEQFAVTDVSPPQVLAAWMDKVKETLMVNATTMKTCEQLDPLVWKNFTQRFTIDPKTLTELVTLKPNSLVFQRDLSPELFHWHDTDIVFFNLNLLKPFWMTDKVCGLPDPPQRCCDPCPLDAPLLCMHVAQVSGLSRTTVLEWMGADSAESVRRAENMLSCVFQAQVRGLQR